MRSIYTVYILLALLLQDVHCILNFVETLKTEMDKTNIIVTQVETEIGSLGGLDDVNAKMENMKVDLQQEVNNSNVLEGIKSIHDFLDSESEILAGVSSSQTLKSKIEGLLDGLEVQMDNLMSTLFDALESDIGNGLRRLGLKTVPQKDVKKLKYITGNLTSLIKQLTKDDQIPAPVMDILGKVKKKIKKGNLLDAITNGRLLNKTFLEDFPEIPHDDFEILEDFQMLLLRVEEELNNTLGDRIREKLKLIDGDMFSKVTRKKMKRMMKDLEIPIDEIDDIDDIDDGLFESLDIEIDDVMRRLGLDNFPKEDVRQLEPFTNFISSVIDNLTKTEEIPDSIAKIARKVRKALDEGDILKAMKRARRINRTLLQDSLSMSNEEFEVIGKFEMGILGIQKGMDKMLSQRLRNKLKLIEDGTFSNKTRRLMNKLLKSLGFQKKKKKGRNRKKNKSKGDKKDIEEKLKTLKLDKIPDVDVEKLEPLSNVVTSLITNLTKTSALPAAITDITKKVETFVKDGDLVNAVESARQLNSTFVKDFPSLTVEQLGLISDIEVASTAMHSGVDELLDQRVALAQISTSDNNGDNEGTDLKAELGVGTLIVIGALICLELFGTF